MFKPGWTRWTQGWSAVVLMGGIVAAAGGVTPLGIPGIAAGAGMGVGTLATAEAAGPTPFSPTPRHVVLIMLDAFRPDYLLMYDAPHIQELARNGVWVAEAQGVFPSITVPNQYSLVTGAYPATHGLPNNSQFDRNALRPKPGPLRDCHATTIGEALAAAGLTTVAVNHFPLAADPHVLYATGGVETAIALWQTKQPNLLVWYEASVDAVGHQYGPFSAEMRAAVRRVDDEVGQFSQAVRDSGLLDQTLFVVVSDHGMSQQDEPRIDPTLDQVLKDGGYSFTGDANAITPQTDIYWLQYGSSFLYLLPGRFDEARYHQLVDDLRVNLRDAQVLDREDLRKLHADPMAVGDIVVVPEPGHAIGGPSTGGLHGRAKEKQILLVFSGAGVRAGQVWPHASIVDVMPTILAALGVPPPATVEGTALTGILDIPEWKWTLTGRRSGVTAQPIRQDGLLQPVDVAASGFNAANHPALAADGNPLTFWVSPVFASPDDFQPQFVAFDLGHTEDLGEIRLVSREYSTAVGPAAIEVWVGESPDPRQQHQVVSQPLPALTGGAAEPVTLPAGTRGRYVRLVFTRAFTRYIQLAEVEIYSPQPAQPVAVPASPGAASPVAAAAGKGGGAQP